MRRGGILVVSCLQSQRAWEYLVLLASYDWTCSVMGPVDKSTLGRGDVMEAEMENGVENKTEKGTETEHENGMMSEGENKTEGG